MSTMSDLDAPQVIRIADPDRQVRVLVVDDGPDVRLLVRRVLARRPRFEVVGEAVDGLEAIEAAARLQPHVVLLDLAMPKLCGEEALPRIAEVAPASMITVFSASVDDELCDRLRAVGAFECYDKLELPRLPDLLADDYARFSQS
ncbi:MAG: response regulator [Actinobacteria bacterium]|nr:response regulator [Actinomycetota bacterium]